MFYAQNLVNFCILYSDTICRMVCLKLNTWAQVLNRKFWFFFFSSPRISSFCCPCFTWVIKVIWDVEYLFTLWFLPAYFWAVWPGFESHFRIWVGFEGQFRFWAEKYLFYAVVSFPKIFSFCCPACFSWVIKVICTAFPLPPGVDANLYLFCSYFAHFNTLLNYIFILYFLWWNTLFYYIMFFHNYNIL